MNRLLGLFVALGIGLWAQRMLTGPQPGIPRDALILFVLASVLFVASSRPPRPLRLPGVSAGRAWTRLGLVLTLAGLAAGLAALVLLWQDLHSLPGLLLWPAAVVLFVSGTFLEQKRPEGQRAGGSEAEDAGSDDLDLAGRSEDRSLASGHPSRTAHVVSWLAAHWDLLVLLLILAVAAFARFHQLDVYPNGCQSDECNNGLDALKWLRGTPYQPYAETNEGQATLFTYLIALSFRLFGVGVTQMRLVSALVGVLTVLAFYFLARDLYGRKAGLVAAALLSTARWHVTFSRIVYELILQPLAVILLVFFLLRALRGGRRRDWALAGVCLAFGMNTYTAFRVVPFVIAAFLGLWIVRALLLSWASRRAAAASRPATAILRWLTGPDRVSPPAGGWALAPLWRDIEGMALMAGAAFVAVLPLGVYTVQNWNVFISRIQHISVMRDVERIGSNQPIVDNLRKTLYMFNWQGDSAALNNLPGAPMLDTLVAILFVLGLAYALWYALRGRPAPVLYVLWFVAIASLAVLSVAHEAPTARRTIGLAPLIYLLAALVADQLFLAWQAAWGKMGGRAFAAAVGAVVALVALGNARAYFDVQAPNPSVWSAYSPNESAVGKFLTTLPAGSTVLITPQYEHHSSIKLIGREHPYRALNPVADLPFREPATGDLVYVLEPVDKPLLSLLQQVYPGGVAEEHADRYGQELFLSYIVPQADLAATQGLLGQFYASYPPTEAPQAEQAVSELDLDMTSAPLPRPYFALWEGTLLVPEYGDYTFDLLAEGDSAALQIGREHRLDLPTGGQGTLTATLAAGFHPLRLEYRAQDSAGRLRLSWAGPGLAQRIVGGDALYAFQLGGQGLVGYYYPNGEWQGAPALVRNDLLITPNNPLREPFSILWRGKIAIAQEGAYIFGTRSDDGSLLYIDGQLVVDNGGSHGAEDRQGAITLSQGFHDIEVRYNELGGSREMQLWWQPPGQGRAVVDSQYLFPLEGEAIPEGLALPPPPEIAQIEGPGEATTGEVAAPAAQPSQPVGAAPAARPGADFPALAAEVVWEYGGSCGVGQEQLNAPRGVAIDPLSGAVFVADAGNFRVVKLTSDGQFVQAWGQAGEAPDQFQEPYDLAVEPQGSLLVLDAVAQRLLRFTLDGQFQTTFGAELTFYRPRGLAVDAAGQLAVADTGGVRIVRLDASGSLLGQVGGPGSDLATQQPTDAALAPSGDLYFVEAESGAVTWLSADGSLNRWVGPAPASTIDGPHLAWRPAGGLFVSDPEGRRVLLFDPAGEPLGQFGADAGLQKPVGVAASAAQGGLIVAVDSQACRVVAFRIASLLAE